MKQQHGKQHWNGGQQLFPAFSVSSGFSCGEHTTITSQTEPH
jgi:hypothetical protein